MKTIILIILISASLTIHAQNILRVNNIPGINAPYTTIQAAVAAASAGDIILVEGSPINYNIGNLNLTKKLTLKGPGYFLNENTGLQASQYNAYLGGSIAFSPGSDNCVVSGLTLSDEFFVNTSNITISNNRFRAIVLQNTTPCSNLLVTGNYSVNSYGSSISSGSQAYTNVIISNNVLINSERHTIQFNYANLVFGVIKNNVIYNTSNGSERGNVSNFDISSNIFYNTHDIYYTTNATFRNNVFVGSYQSGTDATNIFNASLASLFIALPGNTTDTQWKLKAGSLAIGAGEGGIDCGIYSGNTPYKVSGVATGQPTITSFTVPGDIPQNGTLNVKVSAKVN